MNPKIKKWICPDCECDAFNIMRCDLELAILCYQCGEHLDMPSFMMSGERFERITKEPRRKKKPTKRVFLDDGSTLDARSPEWVLRAKKEKT